MPISLDQFQQSIQRAEQQGGYVALNRQGDLEVKGTGFFGKIASWFRGAERAANENNQVMHAFVSALKEKYGETFLSALPRELGTDGKALSSRQITDLTQLANQGKTQITDLNQYKISQFNQKTNTLRQVFNEVAQQQNFPVALDDLQSQALLSKIEKDIQRASQKNTHVVSTKEVHEIAKTRIAEFIQEKQELLNHVDSLEIPHDYKTMLKELALNHHGVLGGVTIAQLDKAAQYHGDAAALLQTLAQGDLKGALDQLQKLGQAMGQGGFDAFELTLKAGLVTANRELNVQPDDVYAVLNSKPGQDLRGACSFGLTMELADSNPEHAKQMGAIGELLLHTTRILGESIGEPDAAEKAQTEVTSFNQLTDIPAPTAKLLESVLGFELPRPALNQEIPKQEVHQEVPSEVHSGVQVDAPQPPAWFTDNREGLIQKLTERGIQNPQQAADDLLRFNLLREEKMLNAVFGEAALATTQLDGLLGDLENARWKEGLTNALGPTPTVQNVLGHYQFQFQKTDGNGDCFYNSVRHATKENNVAETREKVHQGAEQFLQQLPEDQTVFHIDLQDRYDRGLIQRPARGPGDQDAYGSIQECPVVAKTYDQPVVVFRRSHPSEDTLDINTRPKIYEPNGTNRELTWGESLPQNAIVLVHSGGAHWDGALPTGG